LGEADGRQSRRYQARRDRPFQLMTLIKLKLLHGTREL
jgi:hypothetical protein